jgi:hypothetical protein
VGLTVKNMCFLRGHRFKSGGGRVCKLLQTKQSNCCTEGVPCPTNKGVPYIKFGVWLGCDLKDRLSLLLLFIIVIIIVIIYNNHYVIQPFAFDI